MSWLKKDQLMINLKEDDQCLSNKIDDLLKHKDELVHQLEDNEKNINDLSIELASKSKYLDDKKYEISRLQTNINSANIQIEDLRKQLDDQRA